MYIKHVKVNTFCGITERSVDLGKVNYISGRKGCGKTSFVEAIQKGFTNKSERTEIIRHGEEEATIFIQTSNGLEIDRKIRNGKADYFKLRKPGEAVPSSEKFLKQYYNGDIFKPLEFVSKNPKEQAAIILNLLEIPWTMDDISNWFGEIPDAVNYEAHILQVLGQIVAFYFEQRASINSEVVVLKAQIAGYRNELPPNYDGEEWRLKKVAEYYKAVHDAGQVNKSIDNAKTLIEGLQVRYDVVTAEGESEKQTKLNEFNHKRNEIKEFKSFLAHKTENTVAVINGIEERKAESKKSIDFETRVSTANLTERYQEEAKVLRGRFDADILALDDLNRDLLIATNNELDEEKHDAKAAITNYEKSLASKDQELENINQTEKQFLLSLNEKVHERIKTEDAKVGDARKTIIDTVVIDIKPLRLAADQVADMQSYLRDFDLMTSIIREKLAPKEELSKTLTQRIEKGREMPMELLKIAALPIPGITVDSNGNIRIGETLIDGLSEGEQLELAFRVAKAQAGELKFICLDGWNKINPSDREWIEKEIVEDEFQYLVLETTDSELEIKIEGEITNG